MDWTIVAGRPVYLQLIEQLELAIITGEYPPGEKIPGVRDLAARRRSTRIPCSARWPNWKRAACWKPSGRRGEPSHPTRKNWRRHGRSLARKLVHDFYRQASALGLTKAELAALLEQEEG